MAILSVDRIRLGATAVDKADAIRQAGDLLVNSGCVQAGYVQGMLAREQTMSTYLGNGVSIPHGQFDNRADILQTGISVLQVPAGVEWEDGEKAYLIIGIAASSDEHIGVLANLAEVIEDEEMTQALIQTADPELILTQLGATRVEVD
ncbi:MAG: PTS sugar transporter subunit IIA [Chloroflexi bacterium]|jgi:phosphocarrier protein FPr|nr:PTS sugar transporter subunit IIA [Chloroflexota bacterium]MBP7593297.1 PTS sugar transporter subunit IIA [Chloroflexota bacterium]